MVDIARDKIKKMVLGQKQKKKRKKKLIGYQENIACGRIEKLPLIKVRIFIDCHVRPMQGYQMIECSN